MNIIPYVNRPAPIPWDVAKAIFGATGFGAWHHPSYLSTLFQDSAGTTPSGVGDPVRLVVDISGNGEDLLAANDAQRVTLTQVGGHYGLAFDYADDALSNTFANTLTGELFIAGRKGSIFASFSGSTLTIGPTSYTGGLSGILRAIGDVVGIVLIDRALTEDEQTELVEYYKGKGAKGLLVPGPELMTNPGKPFTSTDGYYTSGTSDPSQVEDGKIKITRGTVTTFLNVSDLMLEAGKAYAITIGQQDGEGSWFSNLQSTSSYFANISPARNSETTYCVSSSGTGNPSIRLQMFGATQGTTAYLSYFSVKELRPQEDWA